MPTEQTLIIKRVLVVLRCIEHHFNYAIDIPIR